ncbi:MAG: hypothetical protein ACLRJV_11155 [Eubacteriales bacterium]
MPVGMFLDMIACWEIMDGAEEAVPPSSPLTADNNDQSIFNLK